MARKVLIVEDESNIAELINLYLKKEGYETMIAEDGGKAVITVDGQVVQELPLDEDTTYQVETPEGYNIVEIKDGWADVIEADCRDGLCADQKRIHKTGETIVCLPHKMVVTIEAGTENTVDAVVG